MRMRLEFNGRRMSLEFNENENEFNGMRMSLEFNENRMSLNENELLVE